MSEIKDSENRPGIAVDARGGAVVDPTRNVLDLVEAAVTRLDDLRMADRLRLEQVRSADLLRVNDLRDAARQRQNDLSAAENRRIDEQATLHAAFQEKLAQAETKRIDAIRAVDVAAVATASERAAQQANVLQTQVATSAETLRALVATTAAQVATQLQQLTSQLTERISSLEKVQYESTGRSRVADPQLDTLMTEMRNVVQAQNNSVGKSEGYGKLIGWGLAAAVILFEIAKNVPR